MKRLIMACVLPLAGLLAVQPTFAQSSDVITLNDATPSIDVAINLPANTTGAVAVDISGASLRLIDETNAIVFEAADARIHGVGLNIAPNTGAHTLKIERLPGVTDASVRVSSTPELAVYGSPVSVTGLTLTTGEQVSLPLNASHPGDTINLTIPGTSAGLLTATFPGTQGAAQLVDAAGQSVARSLNGDVDAMSLLLDPGVYQFMLVSNGLTRDVVAGVQLISADAADITLLPTPTPLPTSDPASVPTVAPTAAPAEVVSCTATVSVNSTNLRSGPGTGYTILNYAYLGQTFQVVGRNPEDNWVLLALNATDTLWVIRTNVMTQGTCSNLAVFNIPLQNAEPAPLVITGPGYGEHEDREHEGSGEHEREHEDDD